MYRQFYSGTSGLVLPVTKALYPPDFIGKSGLTYYGSLFNSLEINSSFYKIPRIATITGWAESVDENFQFTFKLSKSITHTKQLDFNAEDVKLFMDTIANIGSKKGCLLVQFPPGLKIENIDQLQKLLSSIREFNQHDKWKVAVEFRNTTWYNDQIYKLLNQFNATMVIHDFPASVTPIIELTCSVRYLRFHGTEPRYRGSYPNDLLQQYATRIKTWIKDGKSVYAYFNNTMGGAAKNLQTLNSFVHS